MGREKFNTLKVPKRTCTRCKFEWFLRPEVERGKGRTGPHRGPVTGVELLEPLNCPNPKCKSPYWSRKKGLKVKT